MKYLATLILVLFSFNHIFCQTATNSFEYDKDTDRAVVVVQKQEIDSLTTFEKIVLEGFDSKVPFYHYGNKKKGGVAYVILLHGLGDSKEDWVYPSDPYYEWGRNLASIKDSLLALGYSLIIPDAKFHGERSYELDFRPPATLPPVISRNEKDSKTFETLFTSTVKDIRMIMDYVEVLDPGSAPSFGTIGYSLGGNLAILLSVADDRVSSVVGCVAPVNLPANGLEAFDWSEDVIQGQKDITPMNLAAAQEAPIMLLMGRQDYFTTEQEATDFFEKVPTEEKELKFFEAGHILPNEYGLDAIRWVVKYTQ